MISPEFILFVAFAVLACGLSAAHMESADRKDARRRNPERTWDDRP